MGLIITDFYQLKNPGEKTAAGPPKQLGGYKQFNSRENRIKERKEFLANFTYLHKD